MASQYDRAFYMSEKPGELYLNRARTNAYRFLSSNNIIDEGRRHMPRRRWCDVASGGEIKIYGDVEGQAMICL